MGNTPPDPAMTEPVGQAVTAEDVVRATGVEAHRVVEVTDRLVRRAAVEVAYRLEAQGDAEHGFISGLQ